MLVSCIQGVNIYQMFLCTEKRLCRRRLPGLEFACLEEQYGKREAASHSKENIAPWPRISSNDESANLTDLTKKRTATWATLQSPPRLQEFADLKSGSRNTSQNGSSHRKCSAHLRTNSISASKCMDVSK
ncbi:uncharacterized protein LOC123217275 isoform X2 [Mangifera indica]|uniref:uncharacterized protein LOC123217275 isoform X2 n=1 Tax=Mangifera indica TaxID=29780 RepID=UPI001CF9B2C0|nr:uncharacterized protein LOC123217275 isoform X2 [Mangifera indica]